MSTIIINSSISQTEFTKYWITKFFKNTQTIFLMIALVSLIVASSFGLLPSFFIQLAIMIFFVIPIYLFFKSSSVYKKNEVLNLPTTFTFDNENISMKSDFIDKSMPYDQLMKIESDKAFMLVYLSKSAALFVNQNSIALSGQKDNLTNLLSQKEGLDFADLN